MNMSEAEDVVRNGGATEGACGGSATERGEKRRSKTWVLEKELKGKCEGRKGAGGKC